MMPYIKIPLVLTAALANHVALTPPQPPPQKSEIAKDVPAREWMFNYVLRQISPFAKYVVWASSLCEVAVILASQNPDSPLAQRVLHTLTWGTAQSALHIGISPTFIVGWAVAVAGGLIRLHCYRTLGRLFTYELALRQEHQLITEGPYAVVRHPSYTAGMFETVGMAICLVSSGSWVTESGVLTTIGGRMIAAVWMAWSAYLLVSVPNRIPHEDRMLQKQFGRLWDEWAARVPYRLLPGIF